MANSEEIPKIPFQLYLEDYIRNIVREELSSASNKPPPIPIIQEVKYLTREETSALIRVSKVSLNKYRKLGLLVPKKIGGRVLYIYDEVVQAIQENRFDNIKVYLKKNKYK